MSVRSSASRKNRFKILARIKAGVAAQAGKAALAAFTAASTSLCEASITREISYAVAGSNTGKVREPVLETTASIDEMRKLAIHFISPHVSGFAHERHGREALAGPAGSTLYFQKELSKGSRTSFAQQ